VPLAFPGMARKGQRQDSYCDMPEAGIEDRRRFIA
jgi:hypothetical protein